MKAILLLALLSAATVNAQVISLTPSNYFLRIVTQNNVGRFRDRFQDSTEHTIALTNRTLTFTHRVGFAGVPIYGIPQGGPNSLEDRYTWRQIGAASYLPVGGEEITFFVAKVTGGWIARTNIVLEADMTPIFFLPAFVGTLTTGDRLNRTVTTGSPLVMSARNLWTTPYLLQVNCGGSGEEFALFWRFEGNERRQITLAPPEGIEFIIFDLDSAGGTPL